MRTDVPAPERRRFLAGAAAVLPARLARAAAPAPALSVLVSGGSMMDGARFAASTRAAMREHFAGSRRLALVLHATHPTQRDAMEARLRAAFADLGVPAAESLHRRDEAGAAALLEEADAVFVGGGETFVLLRELQRTGQLARIRRRVRAGVRYGGSSAGANVAGVRIGTTNDFPVADVATRDALGLLPVCLNPHHPAPAEATEFRARAAKIRTYLQFNPGERVLALGNAALVRRHAGTATLVAGAAWLYEAGRDRALVTGEPVPELVSPD